MKTLPAPLLAKISWRLLPFLLLMYIMAFLDRANVGFAKQAFRPIPTSATPPLPSAPACSSSVTHCSKCQAT